MNLGRTTLKQASFRLFMALDRIGLHVLPKHYYTPVPDYAWLRNNMNLWTKPVSMNGVLWDLDAQLTWLAETCGPYYREVAGLRQYREVVARSVGAGFGPIESQVLHCVVRHIQPRLIIEVGSGVSTACMLAANALKRPHTAANSKIVCIEPNPKPAFASVGEVEHFRVPVQAIPIELFGKLQAGDLLFIDSSHSLKTGSDVDRIYLDIIPALPAGVIIHIHDIFLPYLYKRDVLNDYMAWQETSICLALLTNNPRLKVLACMSALHYAKPIQMTGILSDYRPQTNSIGGIGEASAGHFPSSLWLQTV